MAELLPTYSPTQVNSMVKSAVEQLLPERITVRGEIRDWKYHHSGHCYFLLKDSKSVLPAVMWANYFRAVRFRPEDGMAVLASGFVDVYVPGGRYQLCVERLEPEGTGALQLAFQQMVARLKSEGLFDQAHKRPLPRYPLLIGIVTSPSGAALADISDSIRGRWPPARLFFFPVPVQGEGAAEQIAATIRWINANNDRFGLELLIVGRGGGSLEDLWTFNEEVLARAIYDSRIPIISAVGHEIDVTIADLVADARASTPSKAGVVAVPDITEISTQLSHYSSRIDQQILNRLRLAAAELQAVYANELFKRPVVIIRLKDQQVDEFYSLLTDAVRRRLLSARTVLEQFVQVVMRIEPHRLIGYSALVVGELGARAIAGVTATISSSRIRLETTASSLQALNPRSVLQRGYSLTTNPRTGSIVRTCDDVRVGDRIITELAHSNIIESHVTAAYNQTQGHGTDQSKGR